MNKGQKVKGFYLSKNDDNDENAIDSEREGHFWIKYKSSKDTLIYLTKKEY